MTDLDAALFEAWNRLSARVREDRVERLRRLARRSQHNLTRPLRPWCLCIRASDTRIQSGITADLTPYKDLDRYLVDHRVHIDAEGLRTLTAPVKIEWPGIPLDWAAKRMGRSRESAYRWLKRGVFEVRYDPPRVWSRNTGHKVPVVWCPRLLDPNAEFGRPGDAIFSGLWEGLHTRIPGTLALDAERGRVGNVVSSFWRWRCPGLAGAACGRAVDGLYAPMPEVRLQGFLGDPLFSAGGGELADLVARAPEFACSKCHGVTGVCLLGTAGWNVFVSRISGGLLYGGEVERPRWVRGVRKEKEKRARAVVAARRARVLAMARRGLSAREMARELGVSLSTVVNYRRAVFRAHGVRDARGLRDALGVSGLTRRQAEVLGLWLEGLSFRGVGERLGLSRNGVGMHMAAVRAHFGVRGREHLRAAWEAERARQAAARRGRLLIGDGEAGTAGGKDAGVLAGRRAASL